MIISVWWVFFLKIIIDCSFIKGIKNLSNYNHTKLNFFLKDFKFYFAFFWKSLTFLDLEIAKFRIQVSKLSITPTLNYLCTRNDMFLSCAVFDFKSFESDFYYEFLKFENAIYCDNWPLLPLKGLLGWKNIFEKSLLPTLTWQSFETVWAKLSTRYTMYRFILRYTKKLLSLGKYLAFMTVLDLGIGILLLNDNDPEEDL